MGSFNSSTFSITIFPYSIPSSSSTILESNFFSASLSKYSSTISKCVSFKACLNSLIKSQKSSFSDQPFLHLPPLLLHLPPLLLHLPPYLLLLLHHLFLHLCAYPPQALCTG